MAGGFLFLKNGREKWSDYRGCGPLGADNFKNIKTVAIYFIG
jgi:hypothetical protein